MRVHECPLEPASVENTSFQTVALNGTVYIFLLILVKFKTAVFWSERVCNDDAF